MRNGASGTVTQGGSTLTQQYVKNVLVENAHTKAQRAAATEDTFARKLREARYAIELEHKLTKNEILDRYLNIVYFGDGAYGVGAAARHYFNEPVDRTDVGPKRVARRARAVARGIQPAVLPGSSPPSVATRFWIRC